MAFVHGTQTRLLFGAYALSCFANEAQVEQAVDVSESTVFCNDAKTYVPGLRDGNVTVGGLFDSDEDAIHDALKPLKGLHDPTPYSYGPEGFALGKPVTLADLLKMSYSIPASVTSLAQVSMSGQADGGVDWGVSLADLTARTATADGDSVDQTESSPDGAVAHLHVVAASGTTPTLDVKVQHSSDDSVWVDLITFGQATGTTSERGSATGTVNRYVRAIWTVGGTDPSFEFAVTFARL